MNFEKPSILSLLLTLTFVVCLSAKVKVNSYIKFQKMEGFGAAVAWYYHLISDHTKKIEIYDKIFKDLKIDIIRFRNLYDINTSDISYLADIVENAEERRGSPIKILISSWTPPAYLKNSGSTVGGTLKKENGKYMYRKFANWWYETVVKFREYGINPTYISIQNEPSYNATWDCCLFDPYETDLKAGYNKTLDSIYIKLQEMNDPPKILAPEVLGIGYNLFQNFVSNMNKERFYGYAHHLYHGGDGNDNPDSFNGNMLSIASRYNDKPIFQTEYDYGSWFNTAWLIHNSLTIKGVSAYLYWALVWPSSGKPLIAIDNNNSYEIKDEYYALWHYSHFINPSWYRIYCHSDNNNLRASAYISPDNDSLVIVLLNVSSSTIKDTLDIQDFNINNAKSYVSNRFSKGSYFSGFNHSSLALQIQSGAIVTISMIGESTKMGNSKNFQPVFRLLQNFPNPFNIKTEIDFEINNYSYDIYGDIISIPFEGYAYPGGYKVNWNGVNNTGKKVGSGVYFCCLKTQYGSKINKMIYLK
ncbi:MAG: hypothetical protein H0Z29_05800 [Candidatus Marinimicrobia bacterium]|nr:hypothetical protein [Candidatus Neomarinimicrobiota bacterium]